MNVETPETHNARVEAGEVCNEKSCCDHSVHENGAVPGNFVCYPDPSTVKAEVLVDLIDGKRITGLQCWRDHGSSRLASHIHVLSELGWLIQRDNVTMTTSKGRRAVIVEYSLPAVVLGSLGERAQKFVRDVQNASFSAGEVI